MAQSRKENQHKGLKKEKQVQSQPFGKGLPLAEQAFLLAALNVKSSNVNTCTAREADNSL